MAVPRPEEEVDSLASLEERISRAVELVSTLRRENEQLVSRLEASESECGLLQQQAAEAAANSEKLNQEIEELRTERKQVRTRIEKLLGQMDLLTTS